MSRPPAFKVDFAVPESFPLCQDYPPSLPPDNPQPASHDPFTRLPAELVDLILVFALSGECNVCYPYNGGDTRGDLVLSGETNLHLMAGVSKTWRAMVKYHLYRLMEWVFPSARLLRLLSPLKDAATLGSHVKHPLLLVRKIRILEWVKTNISKAIFFLMQFDDLRRIRIDALALYQPLSKAAKLYSRFTDAFELDPAFDTPANQGKFLLLETNKKLKSFRDGFVEVFVKLDARHSRDRIRNHLVKVDAGNYAVMVCSRHDETFNIDGSVARSRKLYKIVGLWAYLYGELKKHQQKRRRIHTAEDRPPKRPRRRIQNDSNVETQQMILYQDQGCQGVVDHSAAHHYPIPSLPRPAFRPSFDQQDADYAATQHSPLGQLLPASPSEDSTFGDQVPALGSTGLQGNPFVSILSQYQSSAPTADGVSASLNTAQPAQPPLREAIRTPIQYPLPPGAYGTLANPISGEPVSGSALTDVQHPPQDTMSTGNHQGMAAFYDADEVYGPPYLPTCESFFSSFDRWVLGSDT